MAIARPPIEEAVHDQRGGADGDRAVGDVERREIPAAIMDEQEIDDVAKHQPIVEVAERAADDEREPRAKECAAAATQQPRHRDARGNRDRREQPALPTILAGEEAEGSPLVEREY